jgi:hypothetical protein
MARKHSVGLDNEMVDALEADAAKLEAGATVAGAVDWLPMEAAPKTGAVVILLGPDYVTAPARWRVTRVRQRVNGLLRWVPAAFWVLANVSGNPRVPFEPVGWMEYDGFAA